MTTYASGRPAATKPKSQGEPMSRSGKIARRFQGFLAQFNRRAPSDFCHRGNGLCSPGSKLNLNLIKVNQG
jgi:hypothetical protein